MPNVKTPKGKFVHFARATWIQTNFSGGADKMSAHVVCHKVPPWHRFEVTGESVTCPGCIRMM